MPENRISALQVTGLVKAYPGHADRPAVDGVDFTVEEGHFYTLLGPSGCGKTTTLRCVAGLEKPTDGRVVVDGRVMSDARLRQFMPSHRRPMGMVFQNYAIWPHLSVYENVAFPLKSGRRRPAKAEVRRRVEEALGVVQLADFIDRPATLMSGGQQQRLALARALVREPKILLLDEPLSNLDAKLRDAMRAELRALQRRLGITTLYVTHDQAEALSMSNRVAVMSGGRMVQVGTPREIYTAPKTRFVADFIGESNFLEGEIADLPSSGLARITTPAGPVLAGSPADARVGDAVTVGVRPQDLEIGPAHGRRGTSLPGTVEQVLYVGEHYDYVVRVDTAELSLRLPANHPRLRRGSGVEVFLAADKVAVFSEDRGYAHVSSSDDGPDDPETDAGLQRMNEQAAIPAVPFGV
jgi:iron(III) transport system ATP-binding protein